MWFIRISYSQSLKKHLSIKTMEKIIKNGDKVIIAQSVYDNTHKDFKGVWDVERWDIENWAENDQYDEYRKDRIREFKEEVAAWRRKARKAPSA